MAGEAAYLDKAIGPYSPEVAATARAAMKKLRVRFFFLEGIALDDPQGRLEGDGNQVRSIRLDERAAVLDEPYIRGLMTQALKVAGANLKTGDGQVVLRSTLAR